MKAHQNKWKRNPNHDSYKRLLQQTYRTPNPTTDISVTNNLNLNRSIMVLSAIQVYTSIRADVFIIRPSFTA